MAGRLLPFHRLAAALAFCPDVTNYPRHERGWYNVLENFSITFNT